MQCNWAYNRVGFIGLLPSPHSRRMCNPLPTPLSEAGNWGTEILWKTNPNLPNLVQHHEHRAMASQGFLQQAVWTVSRSAPAPGAIYSAWLFLSWYSLHCLMPILLRGTGCCISRWTGCMVSSTFSYSGWLCSYEWSQWIITDNSGWQKHLNFPKGGFMMVPKPRHQPRRSATYHSRNVVFSAK